MKSHIVLIALFMSFDVFADDSKSNTFTDRLASKNVDNPLPDSITEWGVLAVSASPHTGRQRESRVPQHCVSNV